MRNYQRGVIAIILIAMVAVIVPVESVGAWPSPTHVGYFSKKKDTTGLSVWNSTGGPSGCKASGGMAIPSWVNTKSELIDFVLCRYSKGTKQDKTGAAFIISTLTGKKTRNPNKAQRDDFADRINSVTVKFNENLPACQRNGNLPNGWYNTFYQDDHNDVATYRKCGTQKGKMIVLEWKDSKGKTQKYRIKRYCANPIGPMPPLPVVDAWDVNPSTDVSHGSLRAGDTITWTHTAREVKNHSKATGLTVEPRHTGSTNSWTANTGTLTSRKTGQSVNANKTKSWTEVYTIKASDMGRTFCSALQTTPNSSTNSAAQLASRKCVLVSDQELTPAVDLDEIETITQGDQVKTIPKINNSSSSSMSNVRWQLGWFVSDTDDIDMAENSNNPSVHFKGNYETVRDGSGATIPAEGVVGSFFGTDKERSVIIPVDAEVGSYYCFALSVTPYRPGGGWRHSKPACITVVKSPKLQVHGGDVRTRGDIRTSYSTAVLGAGGNSTGSVGGDSTVFGSWVQYGGLSTGVSTGFVSAGASAGLVSGKVGYTHPNDELLQRLTFSNSNIDDRGYYAVDGIPDLIAPYRDGGRIDCSSLMSGGMGGGVYDCSGDNSFPGVGGVTIPTGRTVVVKVDGTATINGNITYSNEATSPRNLPQVIIYADHIVINRNVTQLDAWLVTPGDGTIKTCNVDVADSLTKDDCNRRLTVNGPVLTGQLHLLRTAGADGSGSDGSSGVTIAEKLASPAEVFRLRPETYLWVASQEGGTHLRTNSVVELPPRF